MAILSTEASNIDANKQWIASLPQDAQDAWMKYVALDSAKQNYESALQSGGRTTEQQATKAFEKLGGYDALKQVTANLQQNYPTVWEQGITKGQTTGGLGQGGDILASLAVFGGLGAAASGAAAAPTASTSALTPLPAGGMTATGTTSAAEAAMGGVGAAAPAAGVAGGAAMPLQAIEGYTAGIGAGEAVAGGVAAGGGFDWGGWADSLNNPESLIAIGSGLQGIVAGTQQQDQAKQAQEAANPWGTSGGYALAGQQLQDLMKDPMQVAATDPAYQLRIQGAQRAMGLYGQDSGAMSVAGAAASTDWYNQRLAQLGQLAGAGLSPAAAGQLGLQGEQAAQETISTGIGRLAYGATAGGTSSATGGTAPVDSSMYTGAPANTVQAMGTSPDLYGGTTPQASIGAPTATPATTPLYSGGTPQASIGTSPDLQALSKLGTTATPLYTGGTAQVRAY